MRSNNKFILVYILVIITLHVIPIGFVDNLHNYELGHFRGDYLIHMSMFLPWMGLVRLHLSGLTNKESGGTLHNLLHSPFTWFFMGILLAAGAEVIQYWMPHRSFNIFDMILNISGLVIGSVVYIDKYWKHENSRYYQS